ncbi:6-phosphogluconolactonase [Maribacter sp. 2307ULW6-5]|uniref:6-phosphogluconolactonase n=1 Tax=Maribacter sp. 2307ULW6-5 TaxID=3386275 RepID=UPI0039BC3575
METRIYENKQAVAAAFAAYFAHLVKDRGPFHLALSGGSTPKLIFDVLAADYGTSIDWSQVHFYWGDERCVPPTDPQSNFRMTKEHLFSKIQVPKENINRILGENQPAGEAMRYANLLEINLDRVEEVPQFDLVLLGMGDDGHTASIFPHQMELWNASDHCAVATHPDTGQQRVTINGKVINRAKEVIFLVTGSSKAEKIKEISAKEAGHESYPASLVAPESGKLTWFLDQDAASLLPSAT